MRKWYKFQLDSFHRGITRIPIDREFKDHEKTMGGYKVDEAYDNKVDFFNKYFFGFQWGRLEYYDKFLRKYIKKEEEVLSVGSGRCANELFLMEGGYKITCSDLAISQIHKQTKELFPEFEFVELNVLAKPLSKRYDSVISLSMIYLFNEYDLLIFFRNMSESLKSGGQLIVDSAGSSDNLLFFLVNDIFYKYENILKVLARLIKERKLYGLVIKHHGYRRTNREIIDSAQKAGFELLCQENFAFLTEFRRVSLFNKLIDANSIAKNLFSILGRNVPYVRMFKFKKVN